MNWLQYSLREKQREGTRERDDAWNLLNTCRVAEAIACGGCVFVATQLYCPFPETAPDTAVKLSVLLMVVLSAEIRLMIVNVALVIISVPFNVQVMFGRGSPVAEHVND